MIPHFSVLDKEIPEIYKPEGLLFHYTSYCKGVLILNSEELRVFPRKNSNDPIESLQEYIRLLLYTKRGDNSQNFYDSTSPTTDDYKSKIDLILNESKQVCFCVNRINESGVDYGFLKPRMWNQYGENYRGVCLIFDKEKLIKNNQEKIKSSRYVNYINFEELSKFKFQIDLNRLDSEGEKYMNELEEEIYSKLNSKHIDYSSENEFRIVTSSDEEFDTLNFSGCLVGIIFSSVLNTDNFVNKSNYLKQYCDSKGVDFTTLNWRRDGFKIYPEEKS